MKCPKCQFENPENMQFCGRCGSKLANLCLECEFANPPEFQFCGKCGARLTQETPPSVVVPKLEDVHAELQRSMPKSLAEKFQSVTPTIEGENRILSILFGDISGSVPITEKMSPEDAADLINECLKMMVDVILKYEGSINRFLGDCVLAFFGTPITRENDSERAILAALEMREAVTELNLNISTGINTGMVYVGSMGPDEHREFTAMGTAVNLAARLEGAAEPGQILVGEATYRLTRRAFEFQPLAPLTLKGIAEPVSAYEVLKVLPQPEKIRGIEGLRAEMIGREKEFADLKECMDELLAGRGQIVSIIGEAGVGKSRLATELKGYIKDKDIRWLEGRCLSIGESIGYWVFIDMLRSYLEFSEEDSSEARGEKIVAEMKALFPQRWEDIVPYIGNLLSVKFGNEWDDKVKYLPAEQVKHQSFLTLRDVFLALAQQKPLLFILEDLHWADNLSLDLLTLLMDVLTLAPLMLLCIYRPDKEHKSWHISTQASGKCLDRYKEITIRALNPQESRRLVESLLSIENLPESVKESILQKAEGNPFFVEEVIRSLMESGVVHRDDERWVAKEEVEEIVVPDTIQNVIMARIDRLEDEVRYVLQSAAVIGRLFRHKLLQYTTQQERNLDRYLWQLEESDLVYEERAIPELEYSFRHALTQETAYNTILSRRRREFHRKVGEGYEALYAARIEEYYEDLAYHYSRSDDSQKALHYLVKAGDKSKEAFANEQAIAYYNQALKLMDDVVVPPVEAEPTLRGHIYQSLGEIYFLLIKYEEALECCRKALDYTTDKKQRAMIYAIMGFTYQRAGEHDVALEHLNAGIVELGDDTESPEMARISIALCWATSSKKNTEKAIDIALRGLKIVEGTEHYFEIVELCRSLVWIYGFVCKDLDKASEYAQKSVEVAQKSGSIDLIGSSIGWLGFVHWRKGEDDVAIKLMREAMEIAKKVGNNFGLGQGYILLSLIYQKREDWDGVIECLERLSEIPNHPLYMQNVSRLAYAYLQKGNAEKAIEYSKKALEATEMLDSSGMMAARLSIMEEASAIIGKGEEFISYCRSFSEEKGEVLQDLKLTQWYLEPGELSGLFTQTAFEDEFDAPDLKSEWKWVNPRGDSSYSLSSEAGWLELCAASGSILYSDNLNAPRLLQEISGDFAVEVKTKMTSDDLPSVGGLLVWKDHENYIRFEKGMGSKNEISFSANIQREFNCFGRGMLASGSLYLRLERTGDRFSAYCSNDGENWLTCGMVSFPAEDPIQVGIHAIGGVGLFPYTDTATRFDYFKIFRIPE